MSSDDDEYYQSDININIEKMKNEIITSELRQTLFMVLFNVNGTEDFTTL